MRIEDPIGGCWPNAEQNLLLRACLADETTAVEAFEAWADNCRTPTADSGCARLLPLMRRRLHDWGKSGHRLFPELDRHYRFEWARNRVLLNRAAQIMEQLEAAGIPTLLLKGAALAPSVYPEPALRPMRDVDLLVPSTQAMQAVRWLQERRWLPSDPRLLSPSAMRLRHSMDFSDPDCLRLDLHWHVFRESQAPDDSCWSRTSDLRLGKRVFKTLCPEDHLVHACAHGLMWDSHPPIHWIVDAMTILRQPPPLDWNRVIETARSHRVVPALLDGLSHLVSEFNAPIPDEIVGEIKALPVTPKEAKLHRLKIESPDRTRAWESYWNHYRRYFLASIDFGPLDHALWFSRYLRQTWKLEHTWQVPFAAANRLLRPSRKG